MSYVNNFSHFASTLMKMMETYNILLFSWSTLEFISFPHNTSDTRVIPWPVTLFVAHVSQHVCIHNCTWIMLHNLPFCIHMTFNGFVFTRSYDRLMILGSRLFVFAFRCFFFLCLIFGFHAYVKWYKTVISDTWVGFNALKRIWDCGGK